MTLAKRAGAITAQVRFGVLAHMAVLPGDAHHAARFDMVDFRWDRHDQSKFLELNQTIADGGHKADLGAVRQIGARTQIRTIDECCFGDREKLTLFHEQIM
jgi:hypothetical protein